MAHFQRMAAMDVPHTLNIILHIGTGSLALACGLGALLSRKGSPRHRQWGRGFVRLGWPVMLTAALGLWLWRVSLPLAAATLAASYTLLSAWRSLATRDTGPGVLEAVLAGIAAAAALWVIGQMASGGRSWPPAIGYSTAGTVLAWAVYDLSRLHWQRRWSARTWALDHGLKLTATCFAMAAAFAGNVLDAWQPWSQVLPSALGMVALLWLAWRYGWQRSALETGSARR